MRIAGIVAALFATLVGGIACVVLVPTVARVDGWPRLHPGLDFEGGVHLVYRVDAPADDTGDRTREIVARRLEPFDDVYVAVRGGDVIVESRDRGARDRLRSAIEQTTTLDLRAADDSLDVASRLPPLPDGVRIETEMAGAQATRYLAAQTREPLDAIAREIDLGDRELLVGRDGDAWRTYVVEREAAVDGSMIEDVGVELDPRTHQPLLQVAFDAQGTRALAELSERNIDRRIAIVIDGDVTTAPVVREPIRSGRAAIALAGDFDAQLSEAHALASALRAGALPHPLVLEHESVIDPIYDAETVSLALIALCLLALPIAVAGAIRYRRRAAALLLPALVIVSSLAVLALLDASVTLPLVLALLFVSAVSLASAIGLLERARRHPGGTIVPMVIMGLGPFALLLLAGAVLYAAGIGPWRSVAVAFLVCALAGIPTSGAWILAIAGLASDGGRARPRDRARVA